MLDLDDQEPRKIWATPLFVKLVCMFLLDAVVAGEFETLTVIRFEIWIGRRLAKTAEVRGKVSVEDRERITSFGMSVKAFGQEHVRAEMHRAAPELC